MRTSQRIAIVIVLVVVGSALVFYGLLTPEPSYRGKSLSVWISRLEYENVYPTDEQRTALRGMGEPAVTHLITLLQKQDSKIKRKFVAYSRSHPEVHNWWIAPRRVIPENDYHAQAATALGEIGPAARAAVPALTVASTNAYYLVAARAKAALIKIRQDSITPLLTLLEDTHSTNWNQAALTVKYLGTNAGAAVPLMVNALQSTNLGVRQYALWALEGIASRPDISIPALIACLQDQSPEIRSSAIDALCKFNEAKQQIVPLLCSSLQDTDNNVWLSAAFGLEKLLGKDESKTIYVPALVKSLKSSDPTIRANAETFLKRNDPEAAAKILK